MDKIEEPQVNSKDVTVRINYYDKASGKKIGEDFEHVTVTEGEDPVVLKAADLGTFTVDGIEYQVADDAVDLSLIHILRMVRSTSSVHSGFFSTARIKLSLISVRSFRTSRYLS